jgi:hypothetical protein
MISKSIDEVNDRTDESSHHCDFARHYVQARCMLDAWLSKHVKFQFTNEALIFCRNGDRKIDDSVDYCLHKH